MNIRPSALDAAVRPGHVLRVDDVDGLALADLVDSVSADLPVFLDHRGPGDRTAREVVREVLDALEDIVVALFPVWLPGHEPGFFRSLAPGAPADQHYLSVERAHGLTSCRGLAVSQGPHHRTTPSRCRIQPDR